MVLFDEVFLVFDPLSIKRQTLDYRGDNQAFVFFLPPQYLS
ncbi:MAG: hypothetical protein U5L45_13205 [Saprospiraceae bacterium]|nr:hypothetical protein [Saprospiraceae bacterium]